MGPVISDGSGKEMGGCPRQSILQSIDGDEPEIDGEAQPGSGCGNLAGADAGCVGADVWIDYQLHDYLIHDSGEAGNNFEQAQAGGREAEGC